MDAVEEDRWRGHDTQLISITSVSVDFALVLESGAGWA